MDPNLFPRCWDQQMYFVKIDFFHFWKNVKNWSFLPLTFSGFEEPGPTEMSFSYGMHKWCAANRQSGSSQFLLDATEENAKSDEILKNGSFWPLFHLLYLRTARRSEGLVSRKIGARLRAYTTQSAKAQILVLPGGGIKDMKNGNMHFWQRTQGRRWYPESNLVW